MRCTEICTLTEQRCPAGFLCVPAGEDDGVCWPGQSEEEDGGGGCRVAHSPRVPWLPLALSVIALFAFLGRRRQGSRG